MDWDGIGTAAMFLSGGVIGVGVILLQAYRAKLAARIEQERLRRAGSDTEDILESIRHLTDGLSRLNERVEFTERLLEPGHDAGEAPTEADPLP